MGSMRKKIMAAKIKLNAPAPLYEQIEMDLRRKIREGFLKRGELIGSQSELCKEYSVSTITIKKALANLVHEGVLMTRVGKGTYVADQSQKRMDLTRHRAIGLVLRDLKHPYFSLIVHGVEERAYELGFNVLLANSSNSIEKEENQINHFRRMGVDGLIIASLGYEYRATPYIQRLHQEDFPYVMVSYMHDPQYWYVGTDHELGGFIATEHLIKIGYRSVGYLHIGPGNLLSEVRKKGYHRALAEHDRPFDQKLVFNLTNEPQDTGKDRFQLGYEFGKHFKGLRKRPEALFIYSDLVAMGFEHAATESELGIPEDVAIVGYDDIAIAKYAPVPLSTVHQPAEKIGKMAVDVVQKRINGSDVGNRIVETPTLVIRDSCGGKQSKKTSVMPGSSDVAITR
jgi:DNA-binding LacI/PurR family transcriptional regulator